MSKPLFIIIDGHSFIHRAYHGLPPLSNKEGFPTQVISGVSSMINKAIKFLKPEKIVVAFDHKGKTFRHDMYTDYKGNRPPMPDDFKCQIQPLKNVLEAWGLPMMSIEGVEADDSMSALALQAKKDGYSVVMLTSDKDMRQVVQEDIGILDTKDIKNSDIVMYRDGVKEKMGVYPEQVIPFLALVGDKADNIPGVQGVAEVTATKWMNEYETLDNLLANKDNIKGKVGENFVAAVADGSFDLALKLVTIKLDVDLGCKPSEFIGQRDDKTLFKLLDQYDMHSLKKALGVVNNDAKHAHLNVITEPTAVQSFMNNLFTSQKLFAETIEMDEKEQLIMSTEKTDDVFLVDIDTHKIILEKQIRLMANNHEARFISLDAKNVLNLLYSKTNNKIVFNCLVDDVRVYDYILGQERSGAKGATIEHLNNDYCKFNLSPLREEFSLNGKSPKWKKMTNEQILEVRSEEISIAKNIMNNKIEDFDRNSSRLDNSMVNVLSYMETKGVLVDKDKLEFIGEDLTVSIEQIEKNIYAIAGETFNINSPKKVGDILFTKLEIPTKKKTTAEDVLLKAIDGIEKSDDFDDVRKGQLKGIIEDILKYRSLTKLKSTYINGLIERLSEQSRIHSTFNLTIAKTGRLTSEDPNLQNIPIRNEEGAKIRKAFKASSGYKILTFDYSQVELRILSHFSNDSNFIDAFINGEDIHNRTAQNIFGLAVEDLTDQHRRIAKAINFGLIYGMGEKRLAEELNIEKKEAKKYYNGFFEASPMIKPYFEDELEKAKENLYIETLFGRKISAKDLNASNSFIRSHAEKSAKNARIQGTAAEIIKKAMIQIFKLLMTEQYDADMLIQVHDELVFEVKEDIAEDFALAVKNIMENVVKMKVPLVVDYTIADYWSK